MLLLVAVLNPKATTTHFPAGPIDNTNQSQWEKCKQTQLRQNKLSHAAEVIDMEAEDFCRVRP